mmetsp:Transcript_7477/g.24833  ORF Transcript_7477/g.24833 Transcript_7477/m.24833 type:complete len:214 (-) Transcript_7477:73-714(-)
MGGCSTTTATHLLVILALCVLALVRSGGAEGLVLRPALLEGALPLRHLHRLLLHLRPLALAVRGDGGVGADLLRERLLALALGEPRAVPLRGALDDGAHLKELRELGGVGGFVEALRVEGAAELEDAEVAFKFGRHPRRRHVEPRRARRLGRRGKRLAGSLARVARGEAGAAVRRASLCAPRRRRRFRARRQLGVQDPPLSRSRGRSTSGGAC